MSNSVDEVRRDAKLVLGGDPAAMSRSGRPGPAAFARALSLTLPVGELTNVSSPVHKAAEGLSRELAGEGEVARRSYREIAGHPDSYVALLGLSLLAWSETSESRVDELMAAVNDLPTATRADRLLRAICLLRTLAIAADAGLRVQAEAIWTVARQEVHGDLAFGVALIGESWFGVRPTLVTRRSSRRELQVPWVYSAIESDRKSLLEDQFLAGSRNIWSFGWRFEPVPGGPAVAAELQAVWAGALWALPDTRRAQAIHLWGRHHQKYAATVASNWLLGSGKEVRRVLNWLEPSFDAHSASHVAESVANGLRVPRGADWYAFLVAMWDELPEPYLLETASRSLSAWTRSEEPAPGEDAARFIAQVSRRLGPQLLDQLAGLGVDSARRIVRCMDARWAADLDPALQAWVRRVAEEDLTQSGAPESVMLLLAALGADWSELERLGPFQPIMVANLVALAEPPPEVVREALHTATGAANAWLDDIALGKYSMGISHPFVLSALIDACEFPDQRRPAVEALVRITQQASVPARDRLEALSFLGELESESVTGVARPPDGQDRHWMDSGPPSSALAVAWLGLRPTGVDWAEAGMELLAASRDSDPVMRAVASRSAAAAVDLLPQESADGVVLGALYDEQVDVLRPVLSATVLQSLSESTRRMVWRRLPERVSSEGRELRALAAGFLAPSSLGDSPEAVGLREALESDRSWYVRRVLQSQSRRT